MIGTGIAFVTDAAIHSEPSPSGNTLSPQEIADAVEVTTWLTLGTTIAHLDNVLLPDGIGLSFESLIMDAERSSTIKISAKD